MAARKIRKEFIPDTTGFPAHTGALPKPGRSDL